jgi:hypothetical protein
MGTFFLGEDEPFPINVILNSISATTKGHATYRKIQDDVGTVYTPVFALRQDVCQKWFVALWPVLPVVIFDGKCHNIESLRNYFMIRIRNVGSQCVRSWGYVVKTVGVRNVVLYFKRFIIESKMKRIATRTNIKPTHLELYEYVWSRDHLFGLRLENP